MQIHFQFSTQLLVCFLLESGGVGYQDLLLLLLLLVFPHIPPCGKGREEEERREVCFPLSFFVARRKEGEGKSFESGYSEEETEEEGGRGSGLLVVFLDAGRKGIANVLLFPNF